MRPVVRRDPAELVQTLEAVGFDDARFYAEPRTRQLIVVTDPQTYDRIHRLILRLDAPATRRESRRIRVLPGPQGPIPDSLHRHNP